MQSLNNGLPQKAIIMGVSGKTAQVFIPLAKFETGFIDSTVSLDPNMVGQEVVVVFANGDRNQGIIVGVLP